jgi:hypothetical protein
MVRQPVCPSHISAELTLVGRNCYRFKNFEIFDENARSAPEMRKPRQLLKKLHVLILKILLLINEDE